MTKTGYETVTYPEATPAPHFPRGFDSPLARQEMSFLILLVCTLMYLAGERIAPGYGDDEE